MDTPQETHIPVMSREVITALNLRSGACVVDCTMGLAGHSMKIAEKIGAKGRIIGIDRDRSALMVAQQRLAEYPLACEFIHEDFRNVAEVLQRLQISSVDAILFDLGISSFQLDNPDRGFSLQMEGPLDMRMDQDHGQTAFDLLDDLTESEISHILKEYGEERWHRRIARYLSENRPIRTTGQLRDMVLRAIPKGLKHQRIHPATRTFQALRIAVNRELESLSMVLDQCLPFLQPGGRICVISFHSLEDRIVKLRFRALAQSGVIKLITKKPLRPSEEEVQDNSRARSARLRAAEKMTESE
jgi:16S rRNA (cytosine1402-N4)-methyltransferase